MQLFHENLGKCGRILNSRDTINLTLRAILRIGLLSMRTDGTVVKSLAFESHVWDSNSGLKDVLVYVGFKLVAGFPGSHLVLK